MSTPRSVVAAAVAVGYRLGFGSRSQVFGSYPYAGSGADRLVAHTFDDGPNEPWTSQILDTLADWHVPGTFFQVGRCAQRYPEVTRGGFRGRSAAPVGVIVDELRRRSYGFTTVDRLPGVGAHA